MKFLCKKDKISWLAEGGTLSFFENYALNETVHPTTSAFCFVTKNNHLLLIKNKKPNRGYEVPGGHVEKSDETILDAMKRETVEEAQVHIKNPQLFCSVKIENPNQDVYPKLSFQQFYMAQLKEEITFEENEEIEERIYVKIDHDSLMEYPWCVRNKELVLCFLENYKKYQTVLKSFSFVEEQCNLSFPNELEIILNELSNGNRYYHNFNHIYNLIKLLKPTFSDFFKTFSKETEAKLLLAIFFHDLIYNPKSHTNEEDSDQAFRFFARRNNLSPELVELVSEMILATKKHEKSKKMIVNIFLDLDLSILGSNKEAFHQYEQDIRNEYLFVPDDIFHTKRKEILEKFKKTSYFTYEANLAWQSKKIKNLHK